MRTISRKWRKSLPRGDFQAMCDMCGVNWPRSKLIRKADGLLCCPDDAHGLDVVSLAEGNAQAANARHYGNLTRDGANWDKDADVTPINPKAIPSVPHNQS